MHVNYLFFQSTSLRLGSSSCSTCSTPTDRSLARGLLDINNVLVAVGLGRRAPAQLNSSSSSSSTTTIPKSMFRSTSETKTKTSFSSSSSANTTPSPLTKKQHKRTFSSPIEKTHAPFDISPTLACRARPCYSPVRPDSLIIPTIPPPPSASPTRTIIDRYSDPEVLDRHFTLRNRTRAITSTPEEDERTTDDDHDTFYSAQSSELSTPMIQPARSSHRSHILDIDTDEQRQHQTNVLPPEIDEKRTYVSPDALERTFLS